MVSLLAAAGLSRHSEFGSDQFVELIILLALLVGIVQIIAGVFKVGFFVHYISQSVIEGFTSGLAIIIIFNQLSAVMGVDLPNFQKVGIFFREMAHEFANVHWLTFIIGVTSFLLLILLKRKLPTSPGPFIVIIVSIFVVDRFHLDQKGIEIVGAFPTSLPDVSMAIPTVDVLISLVPIACIIALLSFFESFSVAKTLADRKQETIHPNQEFVGLGFANMMSSFTGTIPVGGAISRTAVNYEAGAKTNLSIIITAALMLAAVFYITPLFFFLPKTVLATVIIYAVLNLIHVKQLRYYVKRSSWDVIFFLTTFFMTITVDIFIGLVVGIIISLGIKHIRGETIVN